MLALVAAPLLAIVALRPQMATLSGIAAVNGLIVYPVALAAAVLVYFHWRISGGQVAGWMSFALAMSAAPGIALSGLLANDTAELELHAGWPMVIQLAIVLGELAAVLAAERIELPFDPFVSGLSVGFVLAAAAFVLVKNVPPLDLNGDQVTCLLVVLTLLQLATAWALLSLTTLAEWVRLRLTLALALLSLSQSATFPFEGGSAAKLIGVVTAIAGAVVLCSTAVALLRLSILDSSRTLTSLHLHLEEVEAGARVHRARMHEIGSTVAGIASASRLIHGVSDLPAQRRTLLTDMLATEMARLERLLRSGESEELRELDLDEVIGPLVVSHEARGNEVRWESTGLRVVGRYDAVTEVVNILLDNAAKHGDATGALVSVVEVDGAIEIAVSNTGRGVSPETRRTLFEWGVRGPDSAGQGLGLHIAQTLAGELGGYLQHTDIPGVGTTFVLGLVPAVNRDALRQPA